MTAPVLRAAPVTDQEYFTLLLRLADRLEPASRRRIIAAVEEARAGLREEAIAEALRTLNADAVLNVLSADDIAEGMAIAIVAVSREMVAASGPMAVQQLNQRLGIDLDWDALSHRALLWVKRHGAELVTRVSEDTRTMLSEIIRDSFREPLPIKETARLVRGVIGLNEPQAKALANYWRDLDAAVGDGAITERRAAQLGEMYRQRMLKYRATVITRTETMTAAGNAQREVWRAADGAGQITAKGYIREWLAIARDGHVCEECADLHGARAPIDGLYEDGSDGPPAHPCCRCQERLISVDDPVPSGPVLVEPAGGGTLRPAIA